MREEKTFFGLGYILFGHLSYFQDVVTLVKTKVNGADSFLSKLQFLNAGTREKVFYLLTPIHLSTVKINDMHPVL